MGANVVSVPKFQNDRLLIVACWADGAGMAWDINSYACGALGWDSAGPNYTKYDI